MAAGLIEEQTQIANFFIACKPEIMPVDGGVLRNVHNILGSAADALKSELKYTVQEIKGNIREGVIYCHNFQAKKIHWFLASESSSLQGCYFR